MIVVDLLCADGLGVSKFCAQFQINIASIKVCCNTLVMCRSISQQALFQLSFVFYNLRQSIFSYLNLV